MESTQFASERVALMASILLMEQVLVSVGASLEEAKKSLKSLDFFKQDPEKRTQQVDSTLFEPASELELARWEKLNRVLVAPIEELELTVRPAGVLKREGLVYVGELIQMTERNLKGIKHLGSLSLNQIKEVLASRGLCLGMKIPD